MFDAYSLGVLIAYCLGLWLGWKCLLTGNPILILVGVCFIFGTISAICGDIISLFTMSFHWVEKLIHGFASIFTSLVK
jgi:hypothetical protein